MSNKTVHRDLPFGDIKPEMRERVQLTVWLPKGSDMEAARRASEDALKGAALPEGSKIGSFAYQYSIPAKVEPTPATNKMLDEHHIMVTVDSVYKGGEAGGNVACGKHIFATIIGDDARKKPPCEKCYAEQSK